MANNHSVITYRLAYQQALTVDLCADCADRDDHEQGALSTVEHGAHRGRCEGARHGHRGRVVARIRQVGGGTRIVLAQDADHAGRARRLIAADPAMIDHLHGVDGISITVTEQAVRS